MGSSGTTAGLTLALAALAGAALADPACDPARIDLRGDFGQAQFRVEVADDAAERAQGLMFRESMSSSAGMLFIYETPQHARFWMQNTLIPLDMIFADAAGRVTHVHANAVPKDETVIDGGTGQNAIAQVKAFDDALGLTGLIVTKLDGTAKGGVLLAIAKQRPIPVQYIGVGEAIEDLQPFDARAFALALVGDL